MENERSAAKPRTPPKSGGKSAVIKTGKTAPKILDDENWDLRLGFLMHDVSRLRRIVFDDFMRPLGITRSQWWVLAYLSRHDGMIQSDLASALDLGRAALGGLIDRLEAAELIERRPDGVDRRAKRIYLSPRGGHVIKEMTVLSHEMSERILVGLSVKSRQKLVEMLTVVKKNLLSIKKDSASDSSDNADD